MAAVWNEQSTLFTLKCYNWNMLNDLRVGLICVCVCMCVCAHDKFNRAFDLNFLCKLQNNPTFCFTEKKSKSMREIRNERKSLEWIQICPFSLPWYSIYCGDLDIGQLIVACLADKIAALLFYVATNGCSEYCNEFYITIDFKQKKKNSYLSWL